jgi:charged multivesicular body protein 1
MGQDQTKMLQKQLFDIKLTAKQLVKESARCEKREQAQKLKVKAAIQKGDMESAKIYAQVRKYNNNCIFIHT